MNTLPATSPAAPARIENALPPKRRSLLQFTWAAAGLVLLFSPALWNLFRYALDESFYSHILLIPFACAYLIWQRRQALPEDEERFRPAWLLLAMAGIAILGAFLVLKTTGATFSRNDAITWTVLPFWLLLAAAVGYILGSNVFRALCFPICFLGFLVPFPESLTNSLEIASQHSSAEVYSWLMALSGATYYRDGLIFLLPGWELQVAQECSGIRSSFVLFLTSLVAAHMFLRTPWKQFLIAFFVFPLGILRNAIRIFTLSMLTTYVDPEIIHSPLHHRGGPIFFALSLIPFFALLLWLRHTEKCVEQ